MQIGKKFKGYRALLFITLALFCIALLFFIFLLARKTPQAFPQFTFYLVSSFFIFTFLVFSVALLGILSSIKIIKAIEKMFDFTQKIKQGNFEARVDVKRKDEIGDLGKNLNLMGRTLKKSFESIIEEKEKASSIIQNVGDALLVIDRERKITLLNPVAQALCGFKEEDVLGKEYFKIFKFFDQKNQKFVCQTFGAQECPIEKAISSNQRIEIPEDFFLINKYEKKIEIAGSISPFSTDKSKVRYGSYIIAIHDVTTEREIDRMKSEFISITSHQLRTPLSSIRWYTEMMIAGDAGKLNEKQVNFLQDVHESTITAISLINNLLDVQRIEGGVMKMDLKPMQLKECIDKVVSSLLPLITASNTEVIKDFEEELLPKVKADSKKLFQAFSNIISNAIIYNKSAGKIIINLQKKGKDIVFSCKDSGIGVPVSEQKNIFKKFFRASNTAGVGAPGSGIGLYICRVYIGQMGGKIWFESEGKNKGTTFFVSLPIA